MDWITLIQIAGAAGLVTLMTELIKLISGRGRNRAESAKVRTDAASVLSDSSLKWATLADDRARSAENRVNDLVVKLDTMSNAMDRLETQISRCAGGHPCPLFQEILSGNKPEWVAPQPPANIPNRTGD